MADKDGGTQRLQRQAWLTCFVFGCLAIALLFTAAELFLPVVERVRPEARIASCANNLKQLAIGFALYADADPQELYPALSSEIGRLSFVWESVYPEFAPEPFANLCPASKTRPEHIFPWEFTPQFLNEAFDDGSYFYLGYVVVSDDGMEDFIQAYQDAFSNGRSLNNDVALVDGRGAETAGHLWRLRKGIERVLITYSSNDALADALARIPIVIERVRNHDKGGNVVFMDGHVEFIEFPGKWPMTEKTVRLLNELDAMGDSQDLLSQ